jgi:hypothetical protein
MPGPKTPKIKGTEVLNAVKALRMSRERALALLPKHLHHYLDEQILISTWYPEDDELALLRALVAIVRFGDDPWFTMGRATGQTNLRGVYRNQIIVGDPGRTLRVVGAFWRNAHDTGEMSATFDGERKATAVLRGYARPAKEICGVVRGFLFEMVSLSGGKEVSVTHPRCVIDGAPDCAWQVSWS